MDDHCSDVLFYSTVLVDHVLSSVLTVSEVQMAVGTPLASLYL